MQHEVVAQEIADFFIRIEGRAKEPAIRTAELVRQLAKHSQTEDWPPTPLRCRSSFGKVGVPIEFRHGAAALRSNLIDRHAPRFDSAIKPGRFFFRNTATHKLQPASLCD